MTRPTTITVTRGDLRVAIKIADHHHVPLPREFRDCAEARDEDPVDVDFLLLVGVTELAANLPARSECDQYLNHLQEAINAHIRKVEVAPGNPDNWPRP